MAFQVVYPYATQRLEWRKNEKTDYSRNFLQWICRYDMICWLLGYSDNYQNALYKYLIKNGEKFIHMVKRTTQQKPIIVIKSGRSKMGAAAAVSHGPGFRRGVLWSAAGTSEQPWRKTRLRTAGLCRVIYRHAGRPGSQGQNQAGAIRCQGRHQRAAGNKQRSI